MNYFLSLFISFYTLLAFGQSSLEPINQPKEKFFQLSKDSTNWSVSLVNYPDTKNILRYKKLEFGLQLPQEMLDRIAYFLYLPYQDKAVLNPFVEWDMDIEGHFIHKESGDFKAIDGYYHREYVVNEKTDDWEDIQTTHPFRIRFAPPKNGEWSVKIIAKIKGIEAYVSESFDFNVIESGDPGYVSVHQNNKNLVRNGEIIFPVGHNFAGPNEHNVEWGGGGSADYLGKNLFSNRNSTKATNTREWAFHHQKMEEFFQMGGKYVRSIQSPWATLIEYEKRGNYFDRLHYAWEQDKLMDLCDKYDAMVMFNMLMHTSLTEVDSYNMFHWDWEKWEIWGSDTVYHKNGDMPVYCYNKNPKEIGGKKPHETFFDEEDLKYHEQRTRYYIARYGYSTKIFEFELLSEPFNVNSNAFSKTTQPYFDNSNPIQDQLLKGIENYHDRLSTYIKKHMQHTHHLIGVDYAMSVWKPFESEIKMDQSLKLENIDIIGVNFYSNVFNKYLISKNGNNNEINESENSRAHAFHDLHRWSNKPIILSEFGDGDASQYCSDFNLLYVDAMSAGFSGVCGHLLWDGRVMNEKFLWPTTINVQHFMNSKEVINTLSIGNGEWIQGRQQTKISNKKSDKNALELQYYLAKDQQQAVGYVRNRSFNVFTKRNNDASPGCLIDVGENTSVSKLVDINWKDPTGKNRLRVDGLKRKTMYEVQWFSYKDLKPISSECLKSGKTDLILRYPTLKVTDSENEQPVVFFILKESNCTKK